MQKRHLKSSTLSSSKKLQKLGIESNFFNMIMDIYENPTANILNGERMKSFPLRSGTRQRCPVPPLLLNTVLEGVARAVRQKIETEDIGTGKEEKLYSQMT